MLYHRVTGGGERIPITTRKGRRNDHMNNQRAIIRVSRVARTEKPDFQSQRMSPAVRRSPAVSNATSDETNHDIRLTRTHTYSRRSHQFERRGRPGRGGPIGATRPRVIRPVKAFRSRQKAACAVWKLPAAI